MQKLIISAVVGHDYAEFMAEESGTSRLMLDSPLNCLAVMVADRVNVLQAHGLPVPQLQFDLSPSYKATHRPDATCRPLTADEIAVFVEWHNARLQFVSLKENYGF